MIQLAQRSRWQSWMRMLALDTPPAHESARSIGSGRLGACGRRGTATAAVIIASSHDLPLNLGSHHEIID